MTTACDGEQALSHIQEARPDLVTLDIQMPRKSGVLFYRQMRSSEGLRSIPVIVVTGLRQTSEYAGPFIERFFEHDGRDVSRPEASLDKPVKKDALLATVEALMGRERMTSQHEATFSRTGADHPGDAS